MKRGQLKAIIIILLIIAVVVSFLMFSQKQAGKAVYQKIPQPVHEEKPVEQIIYKVPEKSAPEIPAPVPTVVQPPAVPKPCIATFDAVSCHAATALAMKKCPSNYKCKTTSIWVAAEGCGIEVTCTPPTSGIKSPQYPIEGEKLPYAAGYYRRPATSIQP